MTESGCNDLCRQYSGGCTTSEDVVLKSLHDLTAKKCSHSSLQNVPHPKPGHYQGSLAAPEISLEHIFSSAS